MKPLNILLADDTQSVGLYVSEYLRAAGHGVTYVQTGEAAIDAYLREDFDLVLMDVVMPGMGGLEAIKRIKAIATTRWVPIIIITTGQDDEYGILSGFLAGADDYLLKPIKQVTLDIRVRSMMRIAAMQSTTAQVLDSVIEGIIQIDQVGRIHRFNRAAEKIFGYLECDVLGKNVAMLMPEQERAHHDESIANYVQTRVAKVIGTERRVIGQRKSGELFPMSLGVSEVSTPDGRFFVGLVRDQTAEERLQQQFREKSAELERFFAVSLDMLCIASLEGRIRKLNPAWAEVLGYPLGQLQGADLLAYVHPDDQPLARAALARLAQGQSVAGLVNRYRARNGDYHFIEWHAVPYDNSLIYAAARDVTVARAGERALAESERFMKLLVDVLPGMVAYWTRDRRCSFANARYLAWFGVTQAQVTELSVEQLMGPQLFAHCSPYIEQALHGSAQQFARTLVGADGHARRTWTHYIPDVDAGEVRGFFVLMTDISTLESSS